MKGKKSEIAPILTSERKAGVCRGLALLFALGMTAGGMLGSNREQSRRYQHEPKAKIPASHLASLTPQAQSLHTMREKPAGYVESLSPLCGREQR
tara:strand:- start:45 stop:329 length:285 start_codon:yes stop_codon:yes gene_type:complete